jgi:hypothetical protein
MMNLNELLSVKVIDVIGMSIWFGFAFLFAILGKPTLALVYLIVVIIGALICKFTRDDDKIALSKQKENNK